MCYVFVSLQAGLVQEDVISDFISITVRCVYYLCMHLICNQTGHSKP